MTVPAPDLRDRLADAIRAEWSQLPDDRTPSERIADAVLGIVQPELDRRDQRLAVAEARLARLRAGAEAVLSSRDTASHLLARDFLFLLDEPVLVPVEETP